LINYSILTISFVTYSQVIPNITAGVDTSNVEIKQVYELYKNYLNSYPDNIYNNPYWNTKEIDYYVNIKGVNCNRSSWFMYNFYDNIEDFYKIFYPKILSIIKVDTNRYSIKIIYTMKGENEEKYTQFTPNYITKLYAVKGYNGTFKLENVIDYDTKKWKKINSKYIQYIINPNSFVNMKDVKMSTKFCKEFIKKFKIKKPPNFSYYITNNSDEMGELFNFDYWLSYSTGRTIYPLKEIFTSFGTAYYPHEFVHILSIPLLVEKERTMIINEGFATWLGGTRLYESYHKALISFSNEIQKNDSISIDMIKNNEYRHLFDNNPIYVTGAVICELIYKQSGIEGIKQILNASDEKFIFTLENIFKKTYNEINEIVINYIKNFIHNYNKDEKR
jgi:hypothetical protein